jgi:hypothetical protein
MIVTSGVRVAPDSLPYEYQSPVNPNGFFNSKITTSRWLVTKKNPAMKQSKDDSSRYIKEVMRSSNQRASQGTVTS